MQAVMRTVTATPPRLTDHRESGHPAPTHADRDVARDVIEALNVDGFLHPLGDLTPPPIRVDVADGVVTLRGNTASRIKADHMALAAGSVAGVRAVCDELFADQEIDAAVTRAIDTDPRTGHVGIQVDVREGVVLLSGTVPSLEVARAAEEIAAAAGGVRAVAPRLDVAGARQPALFPTVVLPRIGSLVSTPSGPIGQVRFVVIDTRPRRVTHLVVAGRFPPESELTPGQPQDERLLLVPAESVSLVTQDLVRLHLTPADVDLLPLFDENDFQRPEHDWQHPIDYRWEDVRVRAPVQETSACRTR